VCGATGAQTQLENEQAAFYQQATQEQQQNYGQDQEILSALQNEYSPIFQAGPDQQGFSQGEVTNLNTQATEGTAQNYNQADKALREQQAATGVAAPTGAQQAQQAGLASSAANTESQEKQQITQANYQQGYNEWQQAAGGLGNVASQLNPAGYSGAATGAGEAAGNTANQIASENNSWVNAALGAAGSIGTGIVSGGLDFGGGGGGSGPSNDDGYFGG
jgi:hypothetical protein